MNTRYLVLPLSLSFALAAPQAHALGLGQLRVKSGLNQPLVAEIPILSATQAELDQLDVRLASPDAFARVGLERPGQLTANLQFSLGKNERGQPVILVTTAGKFQEPLLSFLVEAEWGKGTVTREYTALIDPPYIAPAIIRPMTTPMIAAEARAGGAGRGRGAAGQRPRARTGSCRSDADRRRAPETPGPAEPAAAAGRGRAGADARTVHPGRAGTRADTGARARGHRGCAGAGTRSHRGRAGAGAGCAPDARTRAGTRGRARRNHR